MFITHFVGDLHQPLHTGLYSDRGGNDVVVQFFGEETNLHALWDIHLVSRIVSDWQDYAKEQAEKSVRPRAGFGSLQAPHTGPKSPINWLISWLIPMKLS